MTRDDILALGLLSPQACITELEKMRPQVRGLNKPVWLGVRGTAERKRSRLKEARSYLALALKAARCLGNPRTDIGDLLLRSGVVEGAQGDFASAYRLTTEAMNEFILAGSKRGLGRALIDQGQWLNHLSEINLSKEAFLAAGRFLEVDQHEQFAAMYQGLAIISFQESQGHQAILYLDQAAEANRRSGSDEYLKIRWVKAWLMEDSKRCEEALQEFMGLFDTYRDRENLVESALAGLEACRIAAKNSRDLKSCLHAVCSLAFSHDNLPFGLESTLIDLYVKGSDVNANDIKAATVSLSGLYSRLPTRLSEALVQKGVTRPAGGAKINANISKSIKVYYQQLDSVSPKICLERLERIKPSGPELAIWLGVRGTAEKRLSMFSEARRSLALALTLAREFGLPRNILGDLLLRASNVTGADGDFQTAYNLATEAAIELAFSGSCRDVGRSLVDLAQWLYHLDKFDSSEEAFLSADKLIAPSQVNHKLAVSVGLAVIYLHSKDLERSFLYLRQAKRYVSRATSPDRIKIKWVEALLFEEMGRHEASYNNYIELMFHYDREGNLVESSLAGLEACRVKLVGGDSAEETIALIFGLLRSHRDAPKVACSVIVTLYSIKTRVDLADLEKAITEIRRAPEGFLAPARLRFSR